MPWKPWSIRSPVGTRCPSYDGHAKVPPTWRPLCGRKGIWCVRGQSIACSMTWGRVSSPTGRPWRGARTQIGRRHARPFTVVPRPSSTKANRSYRSTPQRRNWSASSAMVGASGLLRASLRRSGSMTSLVRRWARLFLTASMTKPQTRAGSVGGWIMTRLSLLWRRSGAGGATWAAHIPSD